MKLGEILVELGVVSSDRIEEALRLQREAGGRLGEILTSQGWVLEDDVCWALSNQLGHPYVFLTPEIIDVTAVRAVPEELLRAHLVVPILMSEGELTLGMADPTDEVAVETIGGYTGMQVRRALARGSNISAILDHAFSQAPPEPEIADDREPGGRQLVRFHLVQAAQQGATAVYLDPGSNGRAAVSYRLRGTVVGRPSAAREVYLDAVHYIRQKARLDGETGSGQFVSNVAGPPMAVGISLVATYFGTAVAMALHPERQQPPPPEALGLALPAGLEEAKRGLYIVACSDSHTRQTTLHSLLRLRPQGRLVTVEGAVYSVYPHAAQIPVGLFEPAAYAVAIRGAAAIGPETLLIDDLPDTEAAAAALAGARSAVVLAGCACGSVRAMLARYERVLSATEVTGLVRGVLAVRPVRALCPACRGERGPSGRRGCDSCLFTGFGEAHLLSEYLEAPHSLGTLPADAYPVTMHAQAEALVASGKVSRDEVLQALEGYPWT